MEGGDWLAAVHTCTAMLFHCPQLKPAAGGEVSATELHTGKQLHFHALHSVRES